MYMEKNRNMARMCGNASTRDPPEGDPRQAHDLEASVVARAANCRKETTSFASLSRRPVLLLALDRWLECAAAVQAPHISIMA